MDVASTECANLVESPHMRIEAIAEFLTLDCPLQSLENVGSVFEN